MKTEIYFIPILARALESPARRAALIDAFREIARLGQRPDHADGFAQFQEFLRSGTVGQAPALSVMLFGLVAELLAAEPESASSEFAGAVAMLRRVPRWNAMFEQAVRELRPDDSTAQTLSLVVHSRGHLAGTWAIGAAGAVIGGILPGELIVLLATGRVLLETMLTPDDVLWSRAYPGEPLLLAATTAPTRETPTREILLLDGALQLRVFPALEHGRIEIQRLDLGVHDD